MSKEQEQVVAYTNNNTEEKIVFVFWKEVNLKHIWSDSQYKNYMCSYSPKIGETIEVKILEKREDFSFYLCEVVFLNRNPEILWINKETIHYMKHGHNSR
jgi:hypothetical protein